MAWFSSVQSLSQVRPFNTPWTVACQASLSITNYWSLLRLMSVELVMSSNHLSSVIPYTCLQSFPALGYFPMSQFLPSGGQSIGVYFLQDGLVGSPCSPRGSQESSPTPQCKSINSSVLSFLYNPFLSSIHDDWKNHNFD